MHAHMCGIAPGRGLRTGPPAGFGRVTLQKPHWACRPGRGARNADHREPFVCWHDHGPPRAIYIGSRSSHPGPCRQCGRRPSARGRWPGLRATNREDAAGKYAEWETPGLPPPPAGTARIGCRRRTTKTWSGVSRPIGKWSPPSLPMGAHLKPHVMAISTRPPSTPNRPRFCPPRV